jgi:phage-related protein
MGRRKIRNMTYIHSFCLERSLFEELQRRAQASGKSMSMYLEEILRKAFNMDPEDPLADPPPVAKEQKEEEIDPLVELELEDFFNQLSIFEGKVSELEKNKVNLLNWVNQAVDESTRRLRHEKYMNIYVQKKVRLENEWFELKHSFEKLKKSVPKERAKEISKRLADLKRKLKN